MVADAKDVTNSTIVVITLFGSKYIIVNGKIGERSAIIRIFETTFFKNLNVSNPIIFRRNEIRTIKPNQDTMIAMIYTVSGIALSEKATYVIASVDNTISEIAML